MTNREQAGMTKLLRDGASANYPGENLGISGERVAYIATAWSNPYVAAIKKAVVSAGWKHYHFLDSGHELDYNLIRPDLRSLPAIDQAAALTNASVITAASVNAKALRECQAFVMADPAQKGSSMEFGMAVALSKPTVLLVTEDYTIGVMDAHFDYIVHDMAQLSSALAKIQDRTAKPAEWQGMEKPKCQPE